MSDHVGCQFVSDFAYTCSTVGCLFFPIRPTLSLTPTLTLLQYTAITTPTFTCRESKIKFVNAVLRKLVAQGQTLLKDNTSITDNMAPWLLKELESDWGVDGTRRFAAAMLEPSPIHLTINHPLDSTVTERKELEEEVCTKFSGRVLPQGSIRVPDSMTGSVNQWPSYDDGLWWVQDPAATLPALALKSALGDEPTPEASTVVDMCAAPGGKTSQLLSLGFARVTAVESNKRRSKRLRSNLERLGLAKRCDIVVQDGTEWIPETGEESLSGIVVDVPCSAIGTARKRPDVLWRDEDLGNLLDIQWRLATHCADKLLSPGGVMVYATCSVLKRESEDQVRKLLSRTQEGEDEGAEETANVAVLETVPFRKGEIPGFDDAIDDNGWLRIVPGSFDKGDGAGADNDDDDDVEGGGLLNDCDGFFVARLKKN